MLNEYMAESWTRETPFTVEERWLIRLPVRLVRRGDVVSDDPWGAQRKVRWVRWFRSAYGRYAYVYLDASNTRGYVVREEY